MNDDYVNILLTSHLLYTFASKTQKEEKLINLTHLIMAAW